MAITRQEAATYLQQRGLLTKPVDDYTTAYLKRLYGSARKQGGEFSRAQARGSHPKQGEPRKRPPVVKGQRKRRRKIEKIVPGEFIGPLKKGEVRGGPREIFQAIRYYPKTFKDLLPILRAVGYPTGRGSQFYEFLIFGVADESPSYAVKRRPQAKQHYRAETNEATVNLWKRESKEQDIIEWANDIAPYDWQEIISVSVRKVEDSDV